MSVEEARQALAAAATAQRAATVGSWITFAVMVLTFGVAIGGAMAGIPNFPRWRARVVAVNH
jgi:hypothetical protein